MRFLLGFTISIFTLLASSCRNNPNAKDGPVGTGAPKYTIDLLKGDPNEIANFADFFKDISVTPLRLPKGSLIASFDKLVIFDSSYFVLDKKYSILYRFDMQGNLIKTYGKIGLGPGEFKRIDDFDLFGKEVYILSNDNRAIFVYNLEDGVFSRRIPTQRFGSGISILTTDSYLLYCNYNNVEHQKDYNVYQISAEGVVRERYFPFDPNKSSMILPFTGFFHTTPKRVQYYCDAFDETIYAFENNSFVPYISTRVSSDFVKENKKDFKRIVMDRTLMDPSLSYIGSNYLESGRFIVLSYVKEQVIKTAIFDKNDNSIKVIRKGIADPLINLVEGPFLLTGENKFLYAISSETIEDMRKRDPDKFNKISPDQLKVFGNTADSSSASYFILTAVNKE